MPVKAIIDGTLQSIDWSSPDGLSIIWPLPRDPKIDFHTIIKAMLAQFRLTGINVVTEPVFTPSLLHDAMGDWTCVIAITRASDPARRIGLGENVFLTVNDGSGTMVDITPNILNQIELGSPVLFEAQMAESTINVDIFSINTQLSEQLYILLKLILFGCEKPYFLNMLGYIDIIRADGADTISGIETTGGTHTLAARSLVYRTRTLEYMANVPSIIEVLQSTFIAQASQPGAVLTTIADDPLPTLSAAAFTSVDGITTGMDLFIGVQLTQVTGIVGNVVSYTPLYLLPSVGDDVTAVSTAQESLDIPDPS